MEHAPPTGGLLSDSIRQRPRRVLIIVQNLPVPLDRRPWQESLALREAGYGVSVICPRAKDGPRFQVLEGVRIHTYKPPPETSGVLSFGYEFAYCWLRTFLISLRVMLTVGFDVVQACNPPDTYWLLGAFYRLLGKKFVFDQHDLCPEVYESRFGKKGRLLAGLKGLEWLTYKTADHVIVTNESYKAVARRRGGLADEGVTVVRNAPNKGNLYRVPDRPELRRGREHLACYLGIMGPQDDVDDLIRAIGVYVHDLGRTDCSFALLGFGDALEGVQRLTTELGLDDWVTFTGRADDVMIRDYLSTASVGLAPDQSSPLNDVSTMCKTLEYMAFALPVLSYTLPETLVSAGDAATYVDSGDLKGFAQGLAALLGEPERRMRTGNIGLERIQGPLAWPIQAARYVRVFDELTGRPAGGGPTH